MPAASPCLSPASAAEFIRETCFTPDTDPRVGVEAEWIVHDRADPCRRIALDEAAEAAGGGYGGRISFEPGGQVEISSRPHLDAMGAVDATAVDLAVLESRLATAGLGLSDCGRDTWRTPQRVLRLPRYAAMERYFVGGGAREAEDGPTMMCTTASVQVNLSLGGDEASIEARWRNAALLGPVLAAAFANSPLGPDGPTGWKSSRLASWFAIDTSRTAPVACGGAGAADAWTRYVLDARVMFVRRRDDDYVVQHDPLTFAEWMRDGHHLGHPTADDLAYHLTTLFPPVRPRGWLELRMIDMPGRQWWPVPVLVADVLIDAGDLLGAVIDDSAGDRWEAAARHGLDDPVLAEAARVCFDAATEQLTGAAAGIVEEYAERFVHRGRTPADDLLDAEAALT